jgi:outer membrane scaffolding protein for murein synthesis (MipA/OmpV family)
MRLHFLGCAVLALSVLAHGSAKAEPFNYDGATLQAGALDERDMRGAYGASGAQQSDWRVTLGAGVMLKPEYEGGDEYEVMALPMFNVRYKDRAFLNPWHGLGYEFFKDDNFTFGTAVNYDFGRDEDDADRLRGLGDVDAGADLKLFGEIDLGLVDLNLEAAQNLGGHEGFTAEAALMYNARSGQSTFISIGPSITYASDDYMKSYFGVNANQSARSGLGRFNAEGGFKDIGFSANVRHMIDQNWFVNGMASYDVLIGDAADSPVTERDSQPRVLLGAGYSF